MPRFRRRRVEVRTGMPEVAEGWNGLPWGSSLAGFKDRFPRARLTDAGWWWTGEGPEPFCGVPMAITQYGFNAREELETVAFIPDTGDRAQLPVAVVNVLGAPDGMDLRWTVGDVVVAVKIAGVVATLTHPTYTDR